MKQKYKFAVIIDMLNSDNFCDSVGYIRHVKEGRPKRKEVYVYVDELPYFLSESRKKTIWIKEPFCSIGEIIIIEDDEYEREVGYPMRSLRKSGIRIKNMQEMEGWKKKFTKKEIKKNGWMFYQVFSDIGEAHKVAVSVFNNSVKRGNIERAIFDPKRKLQR